MVFIYIYVGGGKFFRNHIYPGVNYHFEKNELLVKGFWGGEEYRGVGGWVGWVGMGSGGVGKFPRIYPELSENFLELSENFRGLPENLT